jgi:hypothetical protein
MNRSLQTIAAALLFACYALPARAEALPKFSDYTVKVHTGKRAKPRFTVSNWGEVSDDFDLSVVSPSGKRSR